MVIDPDSARRFIAGYQALLAEAHGASAELPRRELVAMLVEARKAVAADPARIDAAAASLAAKGCAVDADVVRAARTLRLKPWIYLRDTAGYSVFVDPGEDAAYAVLGLTDPLRELLGDSGAVIRTAVVEYHGRYVCDGLVDGVLWLGPNVRRELNATLARLRKEGAFHARCEGGAGGAESDSVAAVEPAACAPARHDKPRRGRRS